MTTSLALARLRAAVPRLRFMLGLVALSAIVGLLQIGQPLELSLRVLWNKTHIRTASGQVAMVGIDDPALSRVGPWPWRAQQLVQLNEGLFRAGARRVFYDIPLLAIEDGKGRPLETALAQYPGRVFITATLSTGAKGENEPAAAANHLGDHGWVVSTEHWIQAYWNGVESVPYKREVDGKVLEAAEAVIAGVQGDVGEWFPIDYSLSAASIPYVGAAQILDGQTNGAVSGKDVVVGFNTRGAGMNLSVLGQPRQPGTIILILGAETLMQGRPLVVGWLPVWAAAIFVYFLSYRLRRFRWLRFGAPLSFAIVLCLPILAPMRHIYLEVTPALIFLIAVTTRDAWRRFGERQKNMGSTNPVSGLPTLNAIRHDDRLTNRLLVAARVRHFANVLSTLPPHSEAALTRQVVSRLELAVGDGQLLHGDDGNFFWLADSSGFDTIIEQFEALHVLFRTPVRVEAKAFDLDVSFGLDREVTSPLSHRMVTALAAAHAAEQEGICWKLHDPSTASDKEWLLSLLGELDQALVAGRVWVAYQPKFDLRSRRMTGAEALVRWTHETRGPISPSEFVEVAERYGRIGALTAYVLDEALKIAREAIQSDPQFQISVNVSPSLLNDTSFFDVVTSALARHQMPPSCLMLEVTETAAIAKEEAAQLLMKRFRAHGVGLSIDDYGTGLSTLEYLRKIPACELKIDRQFTAELCSSSVDQVVMHSTIQLAHALGMKAVAEGIETEESLRLLSEMGCDIGQGFHLARPIDGASLIAMLSLAHDKATEASG